jgi:LysR family transcriptional regulator, glycine cleavage system transcriptional activator
MSRLPLHTLPAFRTIARLQNLRLAADELHLTHSALSQQVKLLEEQTGVRLFDRVGRRLRLNDAGRALQRSVEAALQQLDDGLRAAAAVAGGNGQPLRLTVLPSFAQRWLLPRMARWRKAHPDISLELHATPQVVDLQREGFHVAVRQGAGPWRGLVAERLLSNSPLIAVASPDMAERLRGLPLRALADQPLLGPADWWQRWLALDGCRCKVRPVADFNDAGHMLQAAEQGVGIALTRTLLAADALRDGRLVQLLSLALEEEGGPTYWLVHTPELADWPPLLAFRRWLQRELRASARGLPPAGELLRLAARDRAADRPGTAAARR